jgi:hypothetical protein
MQGRVELNVSYAVGTDAAARAIGVSKSTLLRRMKQHGEPPAIDLGVARNVKMYPIERLEQWRKENWR